MVRFISLSPILTQILSQIAAKLEVDAHLVLQELRAGLEDERFELRGSYPESIAGVRDCHLVFYDAFSNKMHTGPWEESSFALELSPCLAPQCLVTTYAVTGNLKRGLKALGFRLLPRQGFQGKRESTLAIREGIG